jgi:hypothetical protein
MYSTANEERAVGSHASLPAPAPLIPFPASLPPAGPFTVSMPGGVPLPGSAQRSGDEAAASDPSKPRR